MGQRGRGSCPQAAGNLAKASVGVPEGDGTPSRCLQSLMSVTKFQIKRGSERFGSDGTYENTWVAEGDDNELAVQTHALNTLPPFVITSLGTVFIQSFDLQHEGHKLFY